QRIQIDKPRARKNGGEVPLSRYAALQERNDLREYVERVMLSGISTRKYEEILHPFEQSLGLSKSSVSREFVKASRESLNYLNSRTFPDQIFWCIVLDGIEFGGSIVIVAMGIDTAGNKHFLGVSEGSTENSETCTNLLESIRERKIQFTDRVLAVVDGSKALEKSTRKFFTSVDVQLCYLHKLRNILAKLPRKYHGEFVRKYRQAFNANDFDDALEAMNALLSWLETVSFSAAESLREGLERLLTLHRIKMDPPLRKSFYTTNLIDSAFSNPRSHLNRVKRTQGKTDQVLRWVGALLLEQEKQFRKVRAFKNINKFLVKYQEKPVAEKMAV
ncbi:MAG TPA: transposase, partial [Leptospiraceae bacterium]|nr:transposase [Leptospiraceae bacterium]